MLSSMEALSCLLMAIKPSVEAERPLLGSVRQRFAPPKANELNIPSEARIVVENSAEYAAHVVWPVTGLLWQILQSNSRTFRGKRANMRCCLS